MSNVRVIGDRVTHAVSEHVDFELYAHTACHVRVAWMNDPTGRAKEIAERVDDPVDCMTCLIRLARRRDPVAFALTNPCAEIEPPEDVSAAPRSPRDGPGEPGRLPTFPSNSPGSR